MKVKQNLVDLTNKFLNDFFELCKSNDIDSNRDDKLFYFNFTLADAIAQSDYPRYEEIDTLLMGMSSFDDSIAKAFMNNRCQGFIKQIEKRIENTENDDDYRVTDIKSKEFLKDDTDFVDSLVDGKYKLSVVPCKTKCIDISFKVSNSKSGFEGSAVIHKEWDKVFTSPNDYTEEFVIESVDFYCKGQKIMSIRYKPNYILRTYSEEVTFTHYKFIADINSFYYVLSCNL